MNMITQAARRASDTLTAVYCALMTYLIAAFAPRALAMPRKYKALSFLEYALLAAVIVAVGVVIANFFGDQIDALRVSIGNSIDGLR